MAVERAARSFVGVDVSIRWSVVGRDGRINYQIAEAVLDLPLWSQAVSPNGGLRRGLIYAIRDVCALSDAAERTRRARD